MKVSAGCMTVIALISLLGCSHLNNYQTDGALPLDGLTAPVNVLRDEKGMAYIYAGNTDDALMAQGFVTAQDRLFQMEAIRLIAAGRIAELAGERGKALDVQMRTLGFARHATRHAAILSPETRNFLQKYVDGINAYIDTRKDSHHLEFRLAGIEPVPWTVSDSLSILYFMSWRSSANIRTEIITQMLVEKLGPDKAREIFPVNINPDHPEGVVSESAAIPSLPATGGLLTDARLLLFLSDGPFQIGSNNWAVGPQRSRSGKPIVANDPHLDARILPGPWYPSGLITPAGRAVGVGIPGLPGMVIFRNEHLAAGVTNAYVDCQDLYIETIDPTDADRYLEGETSLPFRTLTEKLKIKDSDAPDGFREEDLTIRYTRRGPVITDRIPSLKTDEVISLRWAPLETMEPTLGLENMLGATSAEAFREMVSGVNQIALNFVFADVDGNIGWQVSGKVPLRSQGGSSVPFRVTSDQDNWIGWIPLEEMPGYLNPEKGWTGTCNHDMTPAGYPYYLSSYFSPTYRYRRLKEIMEPGTVTTVEDHWQYQRDDKNLMAASIAPVMAAALMASDDTRDMGEILTGWDFHDDPEQVAPTVFQAVYREFALRVFQDELGEELTATLFKVWYYWQERLHRMVMSNDSAWFDDRTTADVVENRDLLFRQAAVSARERLVEAYGKDPEDWRWGRAHQMEFVSPIRREGFGKGMLGGGSHPAGGSGETLYRGLYDFNKPFNVVLGASLRMVADLGDADKVAAVLPSGVSGRVFNPHTTDQIEAFMNGDLVYWWFSERAIQSHSRSKLVLSPLTGVE